MSTEMSTEETSGAEVSDASGLYSEFGIHDSEIQDIVLQGLHARVGCSPHHPRTFPGLLQWAETVRALRDRTVPNGWSTRDVKNFPLSMHPSGKVAIAVQTGDHDTGVRSGTPSNRTPKGSTTEGAIAVNQQQLGLFDSFLPLPSPEESGNDFVMWVLLYHVSPYELRFELSLPSKMVGGKIRSWQKRFVFQSIRFDELNIDIGDDNDDGSDIDIAIERRS